MKSNIDLKVIYRYLGLSEVEAGILKKSNLSPRFGKHHKTNEITGLISVSSDNVLDLIAFVEGSGIKSKDTDLYLSFITEYDTRIIDIPIFVNQIVSKLDTEMTLSYTIR